MQVASLSIAIEIRKAVVLILSLMFCSQYCDHRVSRHSARWVCM